MAKGSSSRRSVGIKELKDRASAIIEEVERRQQSVVVTKNSREVARIVPIEIDRYQKLREIGLIASVPKESWRTLKLEPLKLDATGAIDAIRSDREGN